MIKRLRTNLQKKAKRAFKRFLLSLTVGTLVVGFMHYHGLQMPRVNIIEALSYQSGPQNFTEAKGIAKTLFQDHRTTFYCGCRFDKHNVVDLESCGYKIQHDQRRAKHLEWEHIVPVSLIASHLPCWKNKQCCNKDGACYGGRKCCQQIDKNFAKMEADLHNLVPEIGELNALRSNYRFGMLPHIPVGQLGECQFKIDPETRRVEPQPSVQGIIARTYLYMAQRYHIHLSDSQLQLFNAWNAQHPPDQWEIEWDRRISGIQGNHNLYISAYKDTKHE